MPASREARSTIRSLESLRVLELTTAWAGPMAGRILAALGADVVKIESASALDVWRGPLAHGDPSRYPDRVPGDRPYDRNAWFNTQNRGKRSLALDLKNPESRSVLAALVPSVDVVLCNFASGVLDRLGLGYANLVRWRRDIVLVEMPATGRDGPLADMPGVGPTMEALTGMTSRIGYDDGVPTPTGPAYLDPIGAFFGAAAVMVGVRARDRTGRAQRIELAQREAALQFVGELLLDAADGGVPDPVCGNRLPWAAPHDVYPAEGDDQWVAIAVLSDDEWSRLAAVLGTPTSDNDVTVLERLANRESIDARVAAWTRVRDKRAAAAQLQEAGVRAAPVFSAKDLHDDPHLAQIGFFECVEHPASGRHRYQGLPMHLEMTPTNKAARAPLLGEHTASVLAEVGLGPDEIERLRSCGAAEVAAGALG